MKITAKLRYLRIAPRKVRLVANLIRGKSVNEAQTALAFTIKRGAEPMLKLLKSAAANAKEKLNLEKENFYISKITVDEGPKLKRWRPVSRGSTHSIMKRSSHITIILDQLKEKISTKKILKAKKEIFKYSKFKKKVKIKKPKFENRTEIKKSKIQKRTKGMFRRKAF